MWKKEQNHCWNRIIIKSPIYSFVCTFPFTSWLGAQGLAMLLSSLSSTCRHFKPLSYRLCAIMVSPPHEFYFNTSLMTDDGGLRSLWTFFFQILNFHHQLRERSRSNFLLDGIPSMTMIYEGLFFCGLACHLQLDRKGTASFVFFDSAPAFHTLLRALQRAFAFTIQIWIPTVLNNLSEKVELFTFRGIVSHIWAADAV